MTSNTVVPFSGGQSGDVGRRGLMLGAGVAALGVGALSGSGAAAADEPGPSGAAAEESPVTTTLASPPVSGWTYRHVGFFDFSPEGATAQRAWSSGGGVYTANTASHLWASVEIPAGALVRDVELYVRNATAGTVQMGAYLWVAGQPGFAILTYVPVPPNGSVTAERAVLSPTAYGPHPLGTKLMVGGPTQTTPDVLINGARVGFSQGAGNVGLLPAPVRVFDSRGTTKFAAGEARLVTLPSSIVLPGTAGLVANLTTTESAGTGYLTAYPANVARPSASTINYVAGESVANMVTIGVSNARQIRVYSSAATHVILDITGTVA